MVIPLELWRAIALLLPAPADVRHLSETCGALRAELVGAHFKACWSVARCSDNPGATVRDCGLRMWAEHGDVGAVTELMAGVSDPIEIDDALLLAGGAGHADVVRVLSGDVRAGVLQSGALQAAAVSGHVEVVEFLLTHLRGTDGKPREYVDPVEPVETLAVQLGEALYYASSSGHAVIVAMLIDAGADVHFEDDEAILYASSNGRLIVVRQLIAAGADVTVRNHKALSLATMFEKEHDGVVELLLMTSMPPPHMISRCLDVAASRGHRANVSRLLGLCEMKRPILFAAFSALFMGHFRITFDLVCRLLQMLRSR